MAVSVQPVAKQLWPKYYYLPGLCYIIKRHCFSETMLHATIQVITVSNGNIRSVLVSELVAQYGDDHGRVCVACYKQIV